VCVAGVRVERTGYAFQTVQANEIYRLYQYKVSRAYWLHWKAAADETASPCGFAAGSRSNFVTLESPSTLLKLYCALKQTVAKSGWVPFLVYLSSLQPHGPLGLTAIG